MGKKKSRAGKRTAASNTPSSDSSKTESPILSVEPVAEQPIEGLLMTDGQADQQSVIEEFYDAGEVSETASAHIIKVDQKDEDCNGDMMERKEELVEHHAVTDDRTDPNEEKTNIGPLETGGVLEDGSSAPLDADYVSLDIGTAAAIDTIKNLDIAPPDTALTDDEFDDFVEASPSKTVCWCRGDFTNGLI
jgi:hypothetical protein